MRKGPRRLSRRSEFSIEPRLVLAYSLIAAAVVAVTGLALWARYNSRTATLARRKRREEGGRPS